MTNRHSMSSPLSYDNHSLKIYDVRRHLYLSDFQLTRNVNALHAASTLSVISLGSTRAKALSQLLMIFTKDRRWCLRCEMAACLGMTSKLHSKHKPRHGETSIQVLVCTSTV